VHYSRYFHILLLLVLLGASALPLHASGSDVPGWTVREIDGRPYVTMASFRRFYGFPSLERNDKTIVLQSSSHRVEGKVGSVELLINGLKFILSYPLLESNGEVLLSRIDLTKLVEPVLRPGRIRGNRSINTVVLDPGHGGHDPGARSAVGLEKEFALDTALRAKDLLQKSGFQVVMTRNSDRFIPLYERAAFANRFKNAVFISIHYNAGGPTATGIETFTLAPRFVPVTHSDGPRISDLQLCPGNAFDTENMALATAMHSAMIARTRLPDRGIKRARFVVIREIRIPGILLECGFLSNPREARMAASPLYRQQVAIAITRGVLNFRAAIRAQTGGAPDAAQQRLLDKIETSTPSNRRGPTVILPQAP